MGLKSFGASLFARYTVAQTKKWASRPVKTQQKVFDHLIKSGRKTIFGKDHHFKRIQSHQDFVRQVPVRDYEGLKSYVDEMVAGKESILWPGIPLYLAKTSGTTSGSKYIPITKESMPIHIEAARNAILCYIHETGNTRFVNGKMIFLQGSPELTEKNGIKTGRLSGIVAHYVPGYLQKNRMPSWETNRIEDWETKVDAIVEETRNENMTVISGIPPWVQMYFEKLTEACGEKEVGKIFKDFELFIYGGVNYEPYRQKFEKLIGRKIAGIELYPASEGFFAYQDSQNEKGMLLLLDSGIFYEFIKADEFFTETARRLTIGQVELDINYVMIVSTTAGLWGYNLGDTVKFTSMSPYRVVVSGRIKHFISAFGEHVIGKEVEEALSSAVAEFEVQINEFTVAPQINPAEGLPYHEWFIEFGQLPANLDLFAEAIDKNLQQQNSYYKDLITGKVLKRLEIRSLKTGAFNKYMKSKGKLGGQNKLPRLANDRKIADALRVYLV
ncbi:MAG: GH3 auxin-responsive promoter family protein [Leeuwenhoekiella sp.]